MRIVGLTVFLLGTLLLPAQESTTKIKEVPASATPANSGKEMFGAYCASCHGPDGKGDGPAAPALKVRPTDLTSLARNNSGKFPSAQVTSSIRDGVQPAHGSKVMPVWGPILWRMSGDRQLIVTQRITNLTNFVDSLQVK